MLVTLQSVVGSPGVSTLSVAVAAHLEGVLWDCDPSGSSLAAWAGRKPQLGPRYLPEPGWATLERDWLARQVDPPLDDHLTEVCKTPLLAGEIVPRRMRGLDRVRFAEWAHQRSTRQVVADLGRSTALLPADQHVIVARADLPSLWRTWATLLEVDEGLVKAAIWVICAVPKRDDAGTLTDERALEREWGIESSVRVPWDPTTAKRIAQGNTIRTGPLWKRAKVLCDQIRLRFS